MGREREDDLRELLALLREGRPRFLPGRIVITPGALEALAHDDVVSSLRRHVRGDWGDLCEEDREANEHALRDGSRLLSAYKSGSSAFWIITEWDRSVTTILLPSEY